MRPSSIHPADRPRAVRDILLLALGAALLGCTPEIVKRERVVHGTALDHGEALFSDESASPSSINTFSCSTCHQAAKDPKDDRILTGAALAGVTERPTFWAGQENDLLRSINDCRYYFMDAQQPWTPEDEEAKVMYAYLASLTPAVPEPAAFTVVSSIEDLPKGDSGDGKAVFRRACQPCHGEIHTGAGRITEHAKILPDETLADHVGYTADEKRLVFIEKTRHGAFLGYAGTMPPFSREAMSDDQLASLLAYLGLYK